MTQAPQMEEADIRADAFNQKELKIYVVTWEKKKSPKKPQERIIQLCLF